MEMVLFYILAVGALVGAIALVTRVSLVIAVAWLAVCLLCIAGLFALLRAPFLAVLQALISAGAVMILFLFVVMLIDSAKESGRRRILSFGKVIGILATAYLALVLGIAILRSEFMQPPSSGDVYESVSTLAGALVGGYMIPFELVGLLLLISAVAAVVLAKKEL